MQKYIMGFTDPKGSVIELQSGQILFAEFRGTPPAAKAGYLPGCIAVDVTNGLAYVNRGTLLSTTWGLAGGLGGTGVVRSVAGQFTTVTASDTVVTGLATLIGVVATLDSDPVLDPGLVSASIGDQAGTPAAGSFLLKTWKFTSNANPTPIAATVFTKKVNWIAFGS